MMGRIYQRAATTIVDLGEVNELDEDAETPGEKIMDAFSDFVSSGLNERDFSKHLEKYNLPPSTDPAWASLLVLYT